MGMRAERGGEGLKTKGEDGRLDEIRGRKLRGGRWGGGGMQGWRKRRRRHKGTGRGNDGTNREKRRKI